MTDVPPSWSVQPLGALVDVLDARRVPVSAKERASRAGSVPYYGAAGQVGWIDKPLFDEPLVLLGEDGIQFFDPLKRKAYRIDGPSWVNNHAHVLRAKPGVDHRFLEHYLNTFDYRGYANGTTRLKLTQGAMRRIPVALPDLGQQRRIVEILEDHLSRLDAANDYLVAATARLERLAIARWRSIFDELSASLGDRPLLDLARIENGQTPRGLTDRLLTTPVEGAVPFYKVGDMNLAKGREMAAARFYILKRDATELGLHVRAPGLVLIPKRGGAINTNKKRLLTIPATYDLNTLGLRPGPRITPEYLWHWLQGIDLGLIADGSNVPQINTPQIRRLSLPVPASDIQTRVCSRFDEFLDQRAIIASESARARRRASRLRSALLSAAFSGRLTGRSSDFDRAEELAFA